MAKNPLINQILFRLLVYLSIPVALGILTFIYVRSILVSAVDPTDEKIVIFEVPPETSFKQVAQSLYEKDLINSKWGLTALARFDGSDKKIVAGEFELTKSMSVLDILKRLASGDVIKRKIVFKEGASIRELGKLLEDAGLLTKNEFDPSLYDRSLLTEAGLTSDSFEGYLFPNTYTFSRPVTARKIIWTMMEEGDNRWKPDFTDRADQLSLSRHEVLTLASIIEKESGNFDEQPLISSVFHNRLKENMRLQSDPTVIYGIPDFNGNLTREDLDLPTPYNTYTRHGLPPGPICNPGETAIKAALYPAPTQYLYFVADGKGTHAFAATLVDHNRNVQKYQVRGLGSSLSDISVRLNETHEGTPSAAK